MCGRLTGGYGQRMDPITLYLLLFSAAIVLFLVVIAVIHPAQRVCPGCGTDVAIGVRHCRHCGYAFS